MNDQPGPARSLLEAFHGVLAALGRAARKGEEWPPGRLTMPQFKLLLTLVRPWRAFEGAEPDPAPATISSLARHLGLSAPTVTGIVDRLSQAGYVERRRSEKDRRLVEVVPTRNGVNLVSELFVAHDERLRHYFASLDRADAQALLQGLTALAHLIGSGDEGVGDRERSPISEHHPRK